MYQSHTASEWKQYFGLPDTYQVDACLIYGSWKVDEYTNNFVESISTLNIWFEKEVPLPGFAQDIQSYLIWGKRIWFMIEYGWVRLSEYLHLACQFGSKINIFLWSCGWLKPEITTTDIIIPNYSYGDESSTRLYNRTWDKCQYSDELLNNKLRNRLQSLWVTTHQWPLMTCSAMLGETQEDIDTRSAQWYYGVEMESSSVFAISNYFSVPASALIYVADNLVAWETVLHTNYQAQYDHIEQTISLIMQVALQELIG